MKKLDRLLAIVTCLQLKNVVTAKELAQQFDLSIRSIYRDIRSLENAGVPIGSETGTGYFLIEGYSLPPVTLTTEEISALLIAGKITGIFTDEKTKTNFSMALNKVRAVLDSNNREWVSAIEKRTLVFKSEEKNLPNTTYSFDIQNAIFEKKVVEIEYFSAGRKVSTRRLVEPISLIFSEQRWYMVAYCHNRRAYRIFRVDRIQDLRVTENRFQHDHPDNVSIMKKIFESKPLQKVILRIRNEDYYDGLMHKINPGLISEEKLGERIEVSFFTDSLSVLGKWLLYTDSDIEIVQPVELKNILYQYALEISKRYCANRCPND